MTGTELTTYTPIATALVTIQGRELETKQNTQQIAKEKIAAYCLLIASFNAENLTKKSKRAGQIQSFLVQNKVTKASAKRYMEIGQAARSHFKSQNPEDIAAAMKKLEITSENELKKLVLPGPEKTFEDKLLALVLKEVEDQLTDYSETEVSDNLRKTSVLTIEQAIKDVKAKKLKIVADQKAGSPPESAPKQSPKKKAGKTVH